MLAGALSAALSMAASLYVLQVRSLLLGCLSAPYPCRGVRSLRASPAAGRGVRRRAQSRDHRGVGTDPMVRRVGGGSSPPTARNLMESLLSLPYGFEEEE